MPECNYKGGVRTPCLGLLDTGAQVSTITESFYHHHLFNTAVIDTSSIIHITAANRLAIPYIGYIEVDIEIWGRTFPKMGFLVVIRCKESSSCQKKGRVASNNR